MTHVPLRHSDGRLRGRVYHADFDRHYVANYCLTSGWYNRPYWHIRRTSIRSDGTWSCRFRARGYGGPTWAVASFLLPDSVDAPVLAGARRLPRSLLRAAVARDYLPTYERRLLFSGLRWGVRGSSGPEEPGQNLFSDDDRSVWVDGRGWLHLRLTKHGGSWHAAEAQCEWTMGYGTYAIELRSPVDRLDPGVVFGIFVWDDLNALRYHSEIDIEFAKWGGDDDNVAYCVQPWSRPENVAHRAIQLADSVSTHVFEWLPDRVVFMSYDGGLEQVDRHIPPAARWTWNAGSPPVPESAKVHVNLWVEADSPLRSPTIREIVISRFRHIPAGNSSGDRR